MYIIKSLSFAYKNAENKRIQISLSDFKSDGCQNYILYSLLIAQG